MIPGIVVRQCLLLQLPVVQPRCSSVLWRRSPVAPGRVDRAASDMSTSCGGALVGGRRGLGGTRGGENGSMDAAIEATGSEGGILQQVVHGGLRGWRSYEHVCLVLVFVLPFFVVRSDSGKPRPYWLGRLMETNPARAPLRFAWECGNHWKVQVGQPERGRESLQVGQPERGLGGPRRSLVQ